jgi:hypothetical protein
MILDTFKAQYEFTKIEMCYLPGKMLSAMHSHEKVIGSVDHGRNCTAQISDTTA